MKQSIFAKWVLAFACLMGIGASDVTFGQWGYYGSGGYYGGPYGGYGSQYGYGAHYAGYGGYPAYGGYGIGYGWGYGAYGLGYDPYGLGYWPYGLGYAGYYGYGYPAYGYGAYFGFPGYSYGYGFFAPQYYNYIQPVYSNPVVSQPIYSNSPYVGRSAVMTLPQYTATSQSVPDGGEIVLFSPPTNSRDTQYALNGQSYVMKPGTAYRFRNDRLWTIEINSGNGQLLKHSLSSGNYKFKQGTIGTALFSTQDQPPISDANDSESPTNPAVPLDLTPTPPIVPPPVPGPTN